MQAVLKKYEVLMGISQLFNVKVDVFEMWQHKYYFPLLVRVFV